MVNFTYFLKFINYFFDVSGRPKISNCSTPAEKCSEFLDQDFKKVMQKEWSYIKDSGDFIKKINNLASIPKNAILVTKDRVGFYTQLYDRECV